NLNVHHGLLQAVRDVTFRVQKGEVLALAGANGAGKTTLMHCIAGAHMPVSGRVLFNGEDVTRLPAHRRAAMGIALVPEGRRLFLRMTVEENLLLSHSAKRHGPWTLEAVMAAFPQLKARRRAPAGTLSGGERQAT